MEYILTYIWALLIIGIILVAFVALGIFSPAAVTNKVCTLPTNFGCLSYYMSSTGVLSISIEQTTPAAVTLTGIGCNTNTTTANMYTLPTPINMSIGRNYTFAVQCYSAGAPYSSPVGSVFKGSVALNYTDTVTGIPHTIFGAIIEKVTQSSDVFTVSTLSTTVPTLSTRSTTISSSTTTIAPLSYKGVCGSRSATSYNVTNATYSEYEPLSLVGQAFNITKTTPKPLQVSITGSSGCSIVNAIGGGNLTETLTGSSNQETILMPANGNVMITQTGSSNHVTVYLYGNGTVTFGGTGSSNVYNATSGNGNQTMVLTGSSDSYNLVHGSGQMNITLTGSSSTFDYTTTDHATINLVLTGSSDHIELVNGNSTVSSTGSSESFTFENEIVESLKCTGSGNTVDLVNSTVLVRSC